MKTGQYIKEARLRKGITQEELAQQTNINIRTIQRIENGEVNPRAHSLKAIAAILEMDLSLFERLNVISAEEKASKSTLIFLHLSALIFVPTVMMWYFEKDRNKEIKEHGVDVINFQLSMLAILLPCLLIPFLAIFVGLFTAVVIFLNTFRVAFNKPYHYPLTISFLKHEDPSFGV